MKAIAGEIDVTCRGLGLRMYPLLKENEERGGYRTVLMISANVVEDNIMFNQNCKDPILRKIFQDVRFRRAMSLAINREEINDVLYFGKAKPMQMTCHPSCRFYKKEWGEKHPYLRYDPEKANRLLDEMGLDKRDQEGYRLRPDGKRLTVTVDFRPGGRQYGPTLELVKEYWESVGVKTELNPVEWSLYVTRRSAGEHQIIMWGSDRTMEGPLHARSDLANEVGICPMWWKWWQTGGKAGEEPPEDVKQFFRWFFVDWKECAPGTPRYMELAEKIFDWWAEKLWSVSCIGFAPMPVILKNNLENAPIEGMPWGDDVRCMTPYIVEQWYFKK